MKLVNKQQLIDLARLYGKTAIKVIRAGYEYSKSTDRHDYEVEIYGPNIYFHPEGTLCFDSFFSGDLETGEVHTYDSEE